MKKILILTTTFYPDPSVGSVRVTQFAKYLPRYGFLPVILCKDYGYRATDQQLADDVYSGIKIYRLGKKKNNSTCASSLIQNVKTKNFKSKIKKGSCTLAANLQEWFLKKGFGGLFVPSQSVFFWKRYQKKIFKMIAEEQPEVILSTSPQHAMHWVAKSIKQKYSEKIWVADFRDPYTIDRRYAPAGISKIMFPFHRMFERSIYDRADLLIHAIPLHARWARHIFPEAREKIHILTNGIPESLISYVKAQDKNTNPAFTISSVGHIDDDNAGKLATMVLRLLNEGFDIQLRLVGPKPHLPQNLKEQLGNRLILTGPVNHDTALSEIASSDLLTSCLSQERSRVYCLSSKLFEYLATGKLILSINPSRPDRVFARGFKNIVCLEDPSVDKIYEIVSGLMQQEAHVSEALLEKIHGRFSRKKQVAGLAKKINKLLDVSCREEN